jgi:hypothetical protein
MALPYVDDDELNDDPTLEGQADTPAEEDDPTAPADPDSTTSHGLDAFRSVMAGVTQGPQQTALSPSEQWAAGLANASYAARSGVTPGQVSASTPAALGADAAVATGRARVASETPADKLQDQYNEILNEAAAGNQAEATYGPAKAAMALKNAVAAKAGMAQEANREYWDPAYQSQIAQKGELARSAAQPALDAKIQADTIAAQAHEYASYVQAEVAAGRMSATQGAAEIAAASRIASTPFGNSGAGAATLQGIGAGQFRQPPPTITPPSTMPLRGAVATASGTPMQYTAQQEAAITFYQSGAGVDRPTAIARLQAAGKLPPP